jgi:hypothetical protein
MTPAREHKKKQNIPIIVALPFEVMFGRAAEGRHWGADSSADSMSSLFPLARLNTVT